LVGMRFLLPRDFGHAINALPLRACAPGGRVTLAPQGTCTMSNVAKTAAVAAAKAKAAKGVATKVAAATPAALAKPASEPAKAPAGEPAKRPVFGPDAAHYAAHPLTKRVNPEGAREPHVAKASRKGKHMGGANRNYKPGHVQNEAREGTYRKYMLDVILAHRSTHAAIAAYDAKPWPDLRPLDGTNCFTWAAKQGYIVWVE